MNELFREDFSFYEQMKGYYQKVRVFLSSTFHDMEAERDEIVEQAAPRLKVWGEQFGLDIEVLDLRWGIPRGDSIAGRTVPLCLQAMEECKPFVVSLIGHRYGWKPRKEDLSLNIRSLLEPGKQSKIVNMLMENFSPAISRVLKNIQDNIGKMSITEMELAQVLLEYKPDDVLMLVRSDEALRKVKDPVLRVKKYTDWDLIKENETLENYEKRVGELKKGICTLRKKALENGVLYTADWDEQNEKFCNIKVGRVTLVEYVEKYVMNKCIMTWPERFAKGISKPFYSYEKTGFECYIEYFQKLDQYYFRGIEENILDKFFKSEARCLCICGGNGNGKKSILTGLIYSLINLYSVDVIFSYGILKKSDIQRQGEALNLGNLGQYSTFYNDLLMGYVALTRPLVLVTEKIDNAINLLMKKSASSHRLYLISLEECEGAYRYEIPDFSQRDIYAFTEKWMHKRLKRLNEEQMRWISESKAMQHPATLVTFLNGLSSIHNIDDMEKMLIERVGVKQCEDATEKITDSKERNSVLLHIETLNQLAIDCMKESKFTVAWNFLKKAAELEQEVASALDKDSELLEQHTQEISHVIEYNMAVCMFGKVWKEVHLLWSDIRDKNKEEQFFQILDRLDEYCMRNICYENVYANELFRHACHEKINAFSYIGMYKNANITERKEMLADLLGCLVADRREYKVMIAYSYWRVRKGEDEKIIAKGEVAKKMKVNFSINTNRVYELFKLHGDVGGYAILENEKK